MVAILQGAFHVNRFVECKAGAVAFTAKIANYNDSKSNLSTADIFNCNTWRRSAVQIFIRQATGLRKRLYKTEKLQVAKILMNSFLGWK